MYLSDYALNWLAERIAAQAITISLHTGAPGNVGTNNELSTAGGANYARKLVAAADWAVEANAATADNDADIDIFTPNSRSAGVAVSHVGYWFGADFFGWVTLADSVKTTYGQAFTVAAGTADFTFAVAA